MTGRDRLTDDHLYCRGILFAREFLDVGKFIWFIYSNNPSGFQPLINLRGWVKWAAFLSVKITNESLITHTRFLNASSESSIHFSFYGSAGASFLWGAGTIKSMPLYVNSIHLGIKWKFSVRKNVNRGSAMIDLVTYFMLLMLFLPLDAAS